MTTEPRPQFIGGLCAICGHYADDHIGWTNEGGPKCPTPSSLR